MMVVSVLLLVWSSLACQNCFAMDMSAPSSMHATMDCCPTSMDSPEDVNDSQAGKCTTAYMVQQPVVIDEIQLLSFDQIDFALSVYPTDFPSSPSSGVVLDDNDVTTAFSLQTFSSYRKLLI